MQHAMVCPIMPYMYPSYQRTLLRVTVDSRVIYIHDTTPRIPEEGNWPSTYALRAYLDP